MNCLVNMNGKILPLSKAKISVLDHGFIYGDSVYETLRTIHHYPLQLNGHIQRLFGSAKRLELPVPFSAKEIKGETLRTAMAYWKRYSSSELYIRIIISRGFGDIGFDPNLCRSPLLIIIVKSLPLIPKKLYQHGIHVAFVGTVRNNPKSLDPNIKSGNYLNNILAYLEARKTKAMDAIMQNGEGYITEGTTSNIFIVKNEVLYTPSLDSGILKGLTRDLILETAQKNHIQFKETHISKEMLFDADECFFSSSLKGIMAISRCNSKKIGIGKPGHLTKKLSFLFQDAVKKSIEEEYCID